MKPLTLEEIKSSKGPIYDKTGREWIKHGRFWVAENKIIFDDSILFGFSELFKERVNFYEK